MRLRQALAIVLVALLLNACTLVELAYNNAPLYLESRIDDAFELNSEQQQALSKAMEAFFEWHRREELPRYAREFEKAAAQVEDGLTPEEVLNLINRARGELGLLAAGAGKHMGNLLTQIQPEQLIYYDQAYKERIEDDLALLEASEKDRQWERAELHLKRYEDWFGEFGVKQYEQARERFMGLPDFHPQWMARRMARHESFLALMRTQPGEQEIKNWIQAWLVDRSAGVNPQYEQGRTIYWQKFAEVVAQIDKTITPEQREHAVERMRDYAAAFRRLAAESAS
ncbi:MAG: DUF6279 family lipoprotein [Gammaproteobacteria bacterium]